MTALKLHHMVWVGDVAGAQTVLDAGTDVDVRDAFENTPLMQAAESPRAGVDMLKLLVEAGADVNAVSRQEVDMEGKSYQLVTSVLQKALGKGRMAEIKYLLEAGADLFYAHPEGYEAMVNLFYGRRLRWDAELLPAARLLLERGATPNPISRYGESPLRRAVESGRFDLVRLLLDAGVSPQEAGWSDFVLAFLFGTAADLTSLLTDEVDLETPDRFGLTPFHLAVLLGDLEKVTLLARAGADWNRPTQSGWHPAAMAIEAGRPEILTWLLARGVKPDMPAGPLRQNLVEIAVGSRSHGCLEILLAGGANAGSVNDYGEKPITIAEDLASVRILVAAGEALQDASHEMRRAFLGFGDNLILTVSPADYEAGKQRRFGRNNPDRMIEPFWQAMVKTRVSAAAARIRFDDLDYGSTQPVWCNQRFGQTLTPLNDGRFVEIGGEHEDWYDVDFCIYNDVIVYAEGRSPLIFGYPSSLFPPTDFHTATLIGEFIYIIGNLGYIEARQPGKTPVYRLDTRSWQIEVVDTAGNRPGWISRHEAVLVDGQVIMVSGGKVWSADSQYEEQSAEYVLYLDSLTWHKL